MNTVTILIILVTAALLLLITRRIQAGQHIVLRPLAGYQALQNQIGRAIESGRQIHLGLGRASLADVDSAATLAGLAALDKLAKDGSANGTPPLVSVGEATILPAAQATVRHAYAQTRQEIEAAPDLVQFVAHENSPYAYAAGVSATIQQDRVISNLLMGHFGPEIAIMTEAAARREIAQVVASDDPLALAVATAVTDNLLIGEELYAAGAYLQESAPQVASLAIQDMFRLIIIVVILGFTILQLISAL